MNPLNTPRTDGAFETIERISDTKIALFHAKCHAEKLERELNQANEAMNEIFKIASTNAPLADEA